MAGKGRKRTPFKVVAAYDTETCNVGTGAQTRAYPILYILNRFSNIELRDYKPDMDGETITFDRTVDTFIDRLTGIMQEGIEHQWVPVVCAYNLMFDMVSIMPILAENCYLKTTAQSSTNAYTIDVYANETDAKEGAAPLLRFWDTFFLEQNGLRTMGETAGLPKAVGDWDYTLTRTPETPLTDKELFYAKRDVQVIPAYLAYLLHSNEWLTPDMLGDTLLTKTGLVRQMARRTIGTVRVGKGRSKLTLLRKFEMLCAENLPPNYDTYALRKACFRGGFTFTAAQFATQTMTNVVSVDVTSMHHTFINGRMVPIRFEPMDRDALTHFANSVMRKNMDDVLRFYWQPFGSAFHIRIRVTNLRLRENTPFKEWGVALIPRGKFSDTAVGVDYWDDDPAAVAAETATRQAGYVDRALNPLFAFGKLYAADKAILHVNEIELWCIRQVYDWDKMEVLCGEATINFVRPPDYVTLQSNILFERKTDCKRMVKAYTGEPFKGDIPNTIPDGLADEMRAGTMDPAFLNNYYNRTVKGMFNSIYGTMAQDIYKPDYTVDQQGIISVDHSTVATRANWKDKQPRSTKVLYTYGMRIVAGSRMHLVIAMLLIWNAFHGSVKATGGDTDSIKMSVPNDVTDDMIEHALQPCLDAATKAIANCCSHIRREYPQWASPLTHVGGFDVENAGEHYEHHMEYWNKARVSERQGAFHVTMAGLSRPVGAYHIEKIMADMMRAGYTFEQVASTCLGYNVTIGHEACFAMQSNRPEPGDWFDANITDYLGNTTRVHAPAAVALYDTGRTLGDTMKQINMENLQWLHRHGIHPLDEMRELHVEGTPETGLTPVVYTGFENETTLMKGQHDE